MTFISFTVNLQLPDNANSLQFSFPKASIEHIISLDYLDYCSQYLLYPICPALTTSSQCIHLRGKYQTIKAYLVIFTSITDTFKSSIYTHTYQHVSCYCMSDLNEKVNSLIISSNTGFISE